MEKSLQFLNRITLIGYVGAVHFDESSRCIRLQVVTNFGYKNSNGTPIIETTWMPIVFFPPKDKFAKFKSLTGRNAVKVVGRMRNYKTILENGQEINQMEVLASSLRILDSKNSLLLQI